jgi:hypothetical protein
MLGRFEAQNKNQKRTLVYTIINKPSAFIIGEKFADSSVNFSWASKIQLYILITYYTQKYNCPCASLIKHYAMKTYGGVDV